MAGQPRQARPRCTVVHPRRAGAVRRAPALGGGTDVSRGPIGVISGALRGGRRTGCRPDIAAGPSGHCSSTSTLRGGRRTGGRTDVACGSIGLRSSALRRPRALRRRGRRGRRGDGFGRTGPGRRGKSWHRGCRPADGRRWRRATALCRCRSGLPRATRPVLLLGFPACWLLCSPGSRPLRLLTGWSRWPDLDLFRQSRHPADRGQDFVHRAALEQLLPRIDRGPGRVRRFVPGPEAEGCAAHRLVGHLGVRHPLPVDLLRRSPVFQALDHRNPMWRFTAFRSPPSHSY